MERFAFCLDECWGYRKKKTHDISSFFLLMGSDQFLARAVQNSVQVIWLLPPNQFLLNLLLYGNRFIIFPSKKERIFLSIPTTLRSIFDRIYRYEKTHSKKKMAENEKIKTGCKTLLKVIKLLISLLSCMHVLCFCSCLPFYSYFSFCIWLIFNKQTNKQS